MKKILIITTLLYGMIHASELTSMRVACDKKVAAACFQLALLYDEGLGLTKDSEKAKAYYLDACDYGYEKGCTYFENVKTEE